MEKIAEKTLLKTPVFTVVEKEFENISFKPVGLNCNDWVMVVIRDPKTNQFVLVKQTRWGLEDKTIEFPCGTVDDDEIKNYGLKGALANAAIREVEEETGIVVDKSDIEVLHSSFNPNPAYFNNTMTIFYTEINNLEDVFNKRHAQKLDENEDCEVFITDKDDLNPLKDVMSHAMGICACGLLAIYDKVKFPKPEPLNIVRIH